MSAAGTMNAARQHIGKSLRHQPITQNLCITWSTSTPDPQVSNGISISSAVFGRLIILPNPKSRDYNVNGVEIFWVIQQSSG